MGIMPIHNTRREAQKRMEMLKLIERVDTLADLIHDLAERVRILENKLVKINLLEVQVRELQGKIYGVELE